MKIDIPVLLLTGYLGSGKTTLVNHILTNEKGIKFAVIVNDIGEVNIDADLIQKGGVVDKKDESLIALQNGCICCSLKMDLVQQIADIIAQERFDYIVIEASGICEPEPIAQTICSIPRMGQEFTRHGICRLDCITCVVDALRFQSEFACGADLTGRHLAEDDIENLIIQQVEFCNIILLNKASEVKPEELARIKAILHTLQPMAQIIECDYAKVDLNEIIETGLFRFEQVATSAGWVKAIEQKPTEEEEHAAHFTDHEEFEAHHAHHHHHDDDDEHEQGHHHHSHEDEHHHNPAHGEEGHVCDEHCHCGHHHDHDHPHGDEYGISTFVYYRRMPFDIHKFDYFINAHWPKSVIRTKGVIYFSHQRDMSYLFEQAGIQKQLREAGQWYATAPEEDLIQLMQQEPDLMRDWDEHYGDRMIKLVFIGQHMDKQQLSKDLDACLEK